MTSLLLLCPDDLHIDADTMLALFEDDTRFADIRRNTPTGTLVEADFRIGDDYTTARLSQNGRRISLSGTTDAALAAALVIQSHSKIALRIIDTDYTYDLNLSDYATLEELNADIDQARAKGV
jgi:hypothetical protein